jgi:hypothetical protein
MCARSGGRIVTVRCQPAPWEAARPPGRRSQRSSHDFYFDADAHHRDDVVEELGAVSVHVSNILRKLDAASRFDAAEIAQRAGLG